MKIIARTEYGFLITASESEAKQLMCGERSSGVEPKIGMEFNVNSLFSKYSSMKLTPRAFSNLKRDVASLLEALAPIENYIPAEDKE